MLSRLQATNPSPSRRRRAWPALLVVGAALLAGCGGDSAGTADQPSADVSLPLQQTASLKQAAKAAGCELINAPDEGREHADRVFTASDYKTNPPTSGNHNPVPAEDGIYDPGSTPELGTLVHSLEHGRIAVQYKPGTSDQVIAQLEALLAESEGYHMLLYQNTTGMKYAVAATAWTHLLGCPEMNAKVFDAIRTFRTRYTDKAPERVP